MIAEKLEELQKFDKAASNFDATSRDNKNKWGAHLDKAGRVPLFWFEVRRRDRNHFNINSHAAGRTYRPGSKA